MEDFFRGDEWNSERGGADFQQYFTKDYFLAQIGVMFYTLATDREEGQELSLDYITTVLQRKSAGSFFTVIHEVSTIAEAPTGTTAPNYEPTDASLLQRIRQSSTPHVDAMKKGLEIGVGVHASYNLFALWLGYRAHQALQMKLFEMTPDDRVPEEIPYGYSRVMVPLHSQLRFCFWDTAIVVSFCKGTDSKGMVECWKYSSTTHAPYMLQEPHRDVVQVPAYGISIKKVAERVHKILSSLEPSILERFRTYSIPTSESQDILRNMVLSLYDPFLCSFFLPMDRYNRYLMLLSKHFIGSKYAILSHNCHLCVDYSLLALNLTGYCKWGSEVHKYVNTLGLTIKIAANDARLPDEAKEIQKLLQVYSKKKAEHKPFEDSSMKSSVTIIKALSVARYWTISGKISNYPDIYNLIAELHEIRLARFNF